MKERINAIKEYLKYFPDEARAKQNLTLCEYADELDIKLEGKYYPRMDWYVFRINPQITAGKRYSLANSATNYKHNQEDTIIIWHESSGKLAFVDNEYWWDIDDEWKEFMDILKSYNPLDYDEINCEYIYDIEHGKKLINDYEKIVQDFKKKANKKIKEVELKNKKKQLERLQKELEESE